MHATLELPFQAHEGYRLWLAPYTFNGNKYDMLVAYFKHYEECSAVNEEILENASFYTFINEEKLLVVVGEGVGDDSEHIKKLVLPQI